MIVKLASILGPLFCYVQNLRCPFVVEQIFLLSLLLVSNHGLCFCRNYLLVNTERLSHFYLFLVIVRHTALGTHCCFQLRKKILHPFPVCESMLIARAKTQNTPSFFIRNPPDIFDGAIVFILPKDQKLFW